ncbi:unnamed protein product [Bursaphelenchus xylophilus]|uniref:(pine wood nematode) hypothetical protein n=1 Tax=Bursaphelenchus xylophilus TaxID=6326 RepID=A0A1I7RNE2_BURXY|nr:unnamed protein product [Bursaphelenchus xylophilus]CAG9123924.1 unnamed protein product [Bursaphelenchus xylophilus]
MAEDSKVEPDNSEDEESLSEFNLDELGKRCDDVLRIFDQNQKNSIDINEVGTVLRYLRVNATQNQLKDILSQLTKQSDNRILISELKPQLISCMKDETMKPPSESQLQAAFRTIEERFDPLTKDKLEKCLTTRGEPLSQNEVADMMNHLTVKKSGVIDWTAYIRDILYSNTK